jgi:hypothetical protein
LAFAISETILVGFSSISRVEASLTDTSSLISQVLSVKSNTLASDRSRLRDGRSLTLTAASGSDITVETSLRAALALVQVTNTFLIGEGTHGASNFGVRALGAVESLRTDFTTLSDGSWLGGNGETKTDVAFRTRFARFSSRARVLSSTTTDTSSSLIPVSSHSGTEVTSWARYFSI